MVNFFISALSLVFRKNKPTKPIGHVAVCVGHSRTGDQGAYSVSGISEWDYNINVASALKDALEARDFKVTVVSNYPRSTYGAAMLWLANSLRPLKCDVAVELHFNAASAKASGYEYLFLDGSSKGERLAKCLLEAHTSSLGDKQKCRGTATISAGKRGYKFLSLVPPPAAICEPFFGSNKEEWELFDRNWGMLADIYATGIENFLKS
jgi:N-acetylmuramoyl-L-alanine amidase